MTEPATPIELTPAHLADLVDGHAIAPEVAGHVAFSAEDGVVFRWFDQTTFVYQLRRDPDKRVEGRPKYEWPADQPLILNRWREPEESQAVLLVEGTCQHLAVASWTIGVGVYGMSGCWGWSKCDLTWARGREVVVAFDADLTTNRSVHDAAVALARELDNEGATGVRFIRPPGRTKEGLDDVLARRAPETRAPYLAKLVENATTKLGKAPAKKVDPRVDAVAEEIMRAQPVALTAENRVALYQNGAYRPDPAAFNAVAVAVLGESYWPAMRNAAEEFAAGLLYADGQRIPDRAAAPLLNVANGMLDLTTGELLDHDPAYLSAVQLPVAWEPEAACPCYEAWLAEQVGAQADDLEEVVAAMLDPSRTPSKAGFVFGPSRSGKSTLIRLAEAVAGSENTSAVTLAQLAENRFAAVNVYGKILNAAAEVRAGHIEDLDIFKKMTGNDPIEGERKYVQPFKFYNRALFLFAANELPTVGESSRAYSQRIKPFKFGRSFAGREDQGVEDAMMAELPGILVRWVRAWQRFRTRGGYLPTDPAVLREFEARSDRVRLWVHQTCRIVTHDPTGGPVLPGMILPAENVTPRRQLAQQFVTWAAGTGATAMGETKIVDRLLTIEGIFVVRAPKPNNYRGLNLVVLPSSQWREDLDDTEEGGLEAQTTVFAPQNGGVFPAQATHDLAGAKGAEFKHSPLLSHNQFKIQNGDTNNRGQYENSAPFAPARSPHTSHPHRPAETPANPGANTGAEVPSAPENSGRVWQTTRTGETTPVDLDQARAVLIETVRAEGVLTVDVETSGYPVGHQDHQLRTVQLGGAATAVVLDVRDPDAPGRALARDFLVAAPRLQAHSATADLVPLVAAGLATEDAWDRMYDTVIPAKLADPTSTGADPGLKQLSAAVLGDSAVSPAAEAARKALFTSRKWRTNTELTTPVEKSGWAQVDPADPVMLRYAAADVLDCAAIAAKLPTLPTAVIERERLVQRITARVAHRGLRVDGGRVDRLRTHHTAARNEAATRVRGFGVENPGSDRQVAAALTDHGVVLPRTPPSTRYPEGQPSVAASVLEALRAGSGTPGAATALSAPALALVEAVLTHRHHDTVVSTFLEPYHQLTTRGDGRARPTVYTLGTDTGRMSCVRPNLQQLPREGGVRACITADVGQLLISADFQGVELRVAAALSGDHQLARMIAEGIDLHWEIARQVFGPEASKADRYAVKRGVFGHIYGGGIPTLARQVGVAEAVMASAIEVLAAMTPGLAAWSEQIRRAVRAGQTEFPTYAGRIIHFPRQYPHKGPNYAIQGTARELLVDALERWEQTPWAGGVILPVHDEIVAPVPAADAAAATAALVAAMTTELYGVPIAAEASEPNFAWQDAV